MIPISKPYNLKASIDIQKIIERMDFQKNVKI